MILTLLMIHVTSLVNALLVRRSMFNHEVFYSIPVPTLLNRTNTTEVPLGGVFLFIPYWMAIFEARVCIT